MKLLSSCRATGAVAARRGGKASRVVAHRRFVAVLLALALQAMVGPAASAEPGTAASNAASSAAIFKLQGSVQRLTQENAELQARLEARDAELAALRAAKAAPGASVDVAPQRDTAQAQVAARYQQNVDALNASLDRARAQIAEIAGKYRELVTTLRSVESDRTRVAQVGERHAERARACEAQNAALRGIALEAIDSYEGKGVWEAMLAAEPFTQVQRARLENQVDEYRQKIDALYADVGGVPAAPTNATRGGSAEGGGGSSEQGNAPGNAGGQLDGDAAVEDYPVPDAEAPAATPGAATPSDGAGGHP